MSLSVKDMVSGGKKVFFVGYTKGMLHYKTESGFIFEVPVADTGDALFLPEDKAMLFMRWIRKAVDAVNKDNAEGDKEAST